MMMGIINKLRDFSKLSNSEQEVAKYILNNPKSILNQSIREIALKTYTSPATVMRLCSKVCDAGFAEFRVQLAHEIDSFSKKTFTHEDESLFKNIRETNDLIQQIEDSISKSLKLTQHLLNSETLLSIIELVKKANRIDIYGRGASNSVGEDFHYKLYRLGFPVFIHKGIDLQFIQAQNSDENGCAFILSSSGETPEMLRIAAILNQKGTPVVTLTGSQDSSLLKSSDYPLYFKCFESNLRVGAISSRSAMQYVLDVVYFLIYNSDYDTYSKRILSTYVPKDILQSIE